MVDSDNSDENGMQRRTVLSALATTTGVALAGCGGGGDGSSDDGGSDGSSDGGGSDGSSDGGGSDGGSDGGESMGERVPTVLFQWPTGLGATSAGLETGTELAMEMFSEHLGVETEANPKEILTHYNEIFNDARTCHLFLDGQLPAPTLLDPNGTLVEGHITWAGANGRASRSQFANCEFSELVDEQRQTSDPDERRELVQEAMSIASEAVERINLGPSVERGAYRNDFVELPDGGNWGIKPANYDVVTNATLNDADTLSWSQSASALESQTYQVQEDTVGLLHWNYLVYHPLVRFDKDYEIVSGLAEDWEISDNASTFTFTLRDDITFHNGDPVTAEDVKWTYEFLNSNTGIFVQANERPYESINVVDEQTVEINLTESSAPFLREHVAMWGILPKDVWIDAGAEENPENIELDEIVGCGPCQVSNYDRASILQLEPYEDFFDPIDYDIRIQVYQDAQSKSRALQNGDLAWIRSTTRQIQQQIEEQLPDVGVTLTYATFFDQWLVPQMNWGPTKFREFRLAASQAFSRQRESQVADYGDSPPHLYSCFFGKAHPFYPENPDEVLTKIADSPQSNPETAQSILEEAGWSWDDDGRLHYPPDADLSPKWPEGDTPLDHPDQFPCASDYSTPTPSSDS